MKFRTFLTVYFMLEFVAFQIMNHIKPERGFVAIAIFCFIFSGFLIDYKNEK